MLLAAAGVLQRVESLFLRQMPQEAHDQPGGDAEVPPALVERIGQPGQHRIERDAAFGMALRIEEDLGMGYILRCDLFQIGEGEIEEILAASAEPTCRYNRGRENPEVTRSDTPAGWLRHWRRASATPLRCASAIIISGSSVPSI